MLKATYPLQPGCHGGSPSPFDTIHVEKTFDLSDQLYLTVSKYLLKFLI